MTTVSRAIAVDGCVSRSKVEQLINFIGDVYLQLK